MAPDPGGHAPRPGCRRRPGAQRPRHRRRARSTVSCSLAEDATNPGAARATTPDDEDESLLKPMRLQDVNPETRIGAGNMRRVLA